MTEFILLNVEKSYYYDFIFRMIFLKRSNLFYACDWTSISLFIEMLLVFFLLILPTVLSDLFYYPHAQQLVFLGLFVQNKRCWSLVPFLFMRLHGGELFFKWAHSKPIHVKFSTCFITSECLSFRF